MIEPEYHNIPAEALIDRIASGDSVAKIARELGVSRQALHQWLTNNAGDDYQEAQVLSADGLMDKAEDAILDENLDIARARELANHYRHVAKARAPGRYGDQSNIKISGKVTLESLVVGQDE
jgi:transposase-like protein